MMLDPEVYWSHPIFQDSGIKAQAGFVLFREGEPVNSMFILLEGTVELLIKRDDRELVLSFLGPGQYLGEHILVGAQNRKRAFTAKTKTPIKALWIDAALAQRIQIEEPELMIELLKTVFQLATSRLDGTNYLLQHFRNGRKEERFLYLVKYLVQTTGRDHPSGTEVYLPPELLCYYIEMDRQEVEKGLWELQKQGLMAMLGPYSYVVRDKQKLFELRICEEGVDRNFLALG